MVIIFLLCPYLSPPKSEIFSYGNLVDEFDHLLSVALDQRIECRHEFLLHFELHQVSDVYCTLGNQLQCPISSWTRGLWGGRKGGRGRERWSKTYSLALPSLPETRSKSCGLRRAGQMNLRKRNPLQNVVRGREKEIKHQIWKPKFKDQRKLT
jgi:hypothetical protein